MRRSGCCEDLGGLEGKCGESWKGRRGPPSRERETWILVSLVMRERVCVRWGRGVKERSIEPMVLGGALDSFDRMLSYH